MNRFSILLFPLLSLSIFSLLHSQELSLPKITIEAQYKGPHKVAIWGTTSIPPHVFYKIKGYDFQIRVSIIVQGNSTFIDSLLGIVCILPDHSVNKYYFKHDEIIKYSDHEYQYSFPVRISDSGWIRVFIASRKEMQSDNLCWFLSKHQ
jgi:hypothetical protein